MFVSCLSVSGFASLALGGKVPSKPCKEDFENQSVKIVFRMPLYSREKKTLNLVNVNVMYYVWELK